MTKSTAFTTMSRYGDDMGRTSEPSVDETLTGKSAKDERETPPYLKIYMYI